MYVSNGSGAGANVVGGGSPSMPNRRMQHKGRGKHNYNQPDNYHRNIPRPTYPDGQVIIYFYNLNI